jgi:hypothetical protein
MRLTTAFLMIAVGCYGQAVGTAPHLRKQGTATQLMVDGKPFLALSGELGNNTASSMENMRPVWSKLTAGKLNSVLAAVSWAQVEPEEGKYEFGLVDGLIQEARRNNIKLVFLWFGSWKNGLSSYAPYWVKKDYKRFPRIRIKGGGTLELLSTFGTATRDADARAFRALMRHVKEVDGSQHTVIMMQVQNEVGVLRDSRDRCDAANAAFAGQVPRELMAYLQKNKETLAPELREAWAVKGFKTTGTWEEIFGAGKPDSVDMPIQTTSPPMSREEHETAWRRMNWPADEIFMAWHYARFVNKVTEEGKAEYNIPMFVNAWLQQPNTAWPGTFPSGGPLPQVNDVWRAGAPAVDMLTPDIYLPGFDEVCERYVRNGNPFFIPETRASAANALVAFGKYGAIGFSPFGIERFVGAETELALTYEIIGQMAPVIAAHQGKDSITAVRMRQGDAPLRVRLGNYTMTLSYVGRGRVPIAPQPPGAVQQGPPMPAGPADSTAPMEAAAIFVAAGPDEYYMGGGGMLIAFTAETPGPSVVGLGIVQQGKFVDGKWTVVRQLGGDDIGQGEILGLRPNTILRVVLYRYE